MSPDWSIWLDGGGGGGEKDNDILELNDANGNLTEVEIHGLPKSAPSSFGLENYV